MCLTATPHTQTQREMWTEWGSLLVTMNDTHWGTGCCWLCQVFSVALIDAVIFSVFIFMHWFHTFWRGACREILFFVECFIKKTITVRSTHIFNWLIWRIISCREVLIKKLLVSSPSYSLHDRKLSLGFCDMNHQQLFLKSCYQRTADKEHFTQTLPLTPHSQAVTGCSVVSSWQLLPITGAGSSSDNRIFECKFCT